MKPKPNNGPKWTQGKHIWTKLQASSRRHKQSTLPAARADAAAAQAADDAMLADFMAGGDNVVPIQTEAHGMVGADGKGIQNYITDNTGVEHVPLIPDAPEFQIGTVDENPSQVEWDVDEDGDVTDTVEDSELTETVEQSELTPTEQWVLDEFGPDALHDIELGEGFIEPSRITPYAGGGDEVATTGPDLGGEGEGGYYDTHVALSFEDT